MKVVIKKVTNEMTAYVHAINIYTLELTSDINRARRYYCLAHFLDNCKKIGYRVSENEHFEAEEVLCCK